MCRRIIICSRSSRVAILVYNWVFKLINSLPVVEGSEPAIHYQWAEEPELFDQHEPNRGKPSEEKEIFGGAAALNMEQIRQQRT